jgi:DNA polymerase bacteriophage-type
MIPLNTALNSGLPAPHGVPASIDFETRSEVDIKSAGARRYAQSPTTDVLCLAIKIGPAEAIWVPGYPMPTLLAEAIDRGEFLAAWNAGFEIGIWQEIMVPRYGWPNLPVERFKCTMQRAAIVGCPGALEKAAAALRLPVRKDMEGHRLMMKMCKPLPERKGDAPGLVRWHDDPTDHLRLQEYCMGDVRTEALAASYLPEPPPMEVAVMRVDRYINMRGVTIDKLAAEGAAKIARVEKARLNGEMKQITNGQIGSTNQVAVILEFIGRRGVIMDKLRAADVRAVLADEDADESSSDLDVTDAQIAAYGAMDPIAKRVLELRAEASKASTAKLDALVKGTLADGRMVDLFAYSGAYRTARWAGRRFQAHNLPRANPPADTEDQIEAWYDALRSGDHDYFASMIPSGMSVMDGLKSSLRGFITASKGRMLNVADLSQIEARGVAWAAGQWDVIEAFERLDDATRAGADDATIKSLDIYTVTGKKMGADRQGGKVGVLGCGFGAGKHAISIFAAGYGLTWDEQQAEQIVDAWRSANPMVVKAWGNEERAAKEAMANPGVVVQVGDGRSGSYCYRNGNLMTKLPSGRVLVYRNMKIEPRMTPWGQNRMTLTYEANNFAKGRPGEFSRLGTHGGKLFQNRVQAFCRDILAVGLIRADRMGLAAVFHVHDEQGVDSPTHLVDIESDRLVHAMTDPIPWVEGLPIMSSADVSFRYRKN